MAEIYTALAGTDRPARRGGAAAAAILLLWSGAASAQTEPGAAQMEADPIDQSVRMVGAELTGLAEQLDSFFANERVEAEANLTRLRVGGGVGWVDGDGVVLESNFDLRLSLPRTSQRVSLFLSGKGDEVVDDTARQDPSAKRPLSEETIQAIGLGVRYFPVREDDETLRLDVGVRDPLSPDPFIEPRHRVTFHAGEWSLSPIQQVSWTLDDGFSAVARLDADHEVNEARVLRLTPSISWAEIRDGYRYGFFTRDLQLLAPGRAVEIGFGVQFRSQPNHHVETAGVRLRYRQTLYWDWLEFEIAPELTFPDDRDYEITPGIFVRLEITLGQNEFGLNWPYSPTFLGSE